MSHNEDLNQKIGVFLYTIAVIIIGCFMLFVYNTNLNNCEEFGGKLKYTGSSVYYLCIKDGKIIE